MNKIDLYKRAQDLMPYALEFYGDKYKSVVKDTFSHSDIDIMNAIEAETFTSTIKGYHSYRDDINGNYKHVIRVKDEPKYLDTILVHELFGHGVLSNKRPYVTKNGIVYIRNGIQLTDYTDHSKIYHKTLNEGIVEYIANEIKALYQKRDLSFCSFEAYNIARLLFEIFGKEKMLKLLITNKGDLSKELDFFDEMSRKLDERDSDMSTYNLKLIRRL